MPFLYNNTGAAAYSEAVRSFDAPLNDWTKKDVQTLTLFFKGYPRPFVEEPAGTYTMSAEFASFFGRFSRLCSVCVCMVDHSWPA